MNSHPANIIWPAGIVNNIWVTFNFGANIRLLRLTDEALRLKRAKGSCWGIRPVNNGHSLDIWLDLANLLWSLSASSSAHVNTARCPLYDLFHQIDLARVEGSDPRIISATNGIPRAGYAVRNMLVFLSSMPHAKEVNPLLLLQEPCGSCQSQLRVSRVHLTQGDKPGR